MSRKMKKYQNFIVEKKSCFAGIKRKNCIFVKKLYKQFKRAYKSL